MSRSKWKGPFINSKIKKNLNQNNNVIEATRNSKIIPKFVGQTFKIHDGKNYSKITIIKEMLEHRFGEFVFTRKKNFFKKKNK